MDEKTALTWLEALEQRFTETRASKTGEHDVWSAVYSEMRAALDAIFPPSHVVVRQWDDAVARAKKIQSGNAIQTPERWVSDELVGIFRTGLSILKNGYLRSLADGIRAETVAQCLDQADALARAWYAAAAMVLVGGGLETHLRGLCVRLGCSWQGNGSKFRVTSRPSTKAEIRVGRLRFHRVIRARLSRGEKIETTRPIPLPRSLRHPKKLGTLSKEFASFLYARNSTARLTAHAPDGAETNMARGW
jgi:hypothetical protein